VLTGAEEREESKQVEHEGDSLRIRADRSTTYPPDGVLAKDTHSSSVDGYRARVPNAHHRTTPEQRQRADVILRQDDSFLAIGFLEHLVPAVPISSISLLASRRSAVSTSGSVNQL
jgi:hypothetical protein